MTSAALLTFCHCFHSSLQEMDEQFLTWFNLWQSSLKFAIYLPDFLLVIAFCNPTLFKFLLLMFFSPHADDVIMSQRNGRMGRLLSPRHTLPPNTTCTYYFHGFPNDLIWMSFTSHHLQLLQPVTHENLTAYGQVSRLGAVAFERSIDELTRLN